MERTILALPESSYARPATAAASRGHASWSASAMKPFSLDAPSHPPGPARGHGAAAAAPLLADDLLAFGAAALPDCALLAMLLSPGEPPPEREETSGRPHAASPWPERAREGVPAAAIARAAEILALPAGPRLLALRNEPEGPRLLAALELGRRALLWPPARGVCVRGPVDVASVMLTRCVPGRSGLWVVSLDARHRVLRAVEVGCERGRQLQALREAIFREAIFADACALVLAQRAEAWPRGRRPVLRRALRQWEGTALALGLRLLDMVLLGDAGHESMRQQGVFQAGRSRSYAAWARGSDD